MPEWLDRCRTETPGTQEHSLEAQSLETHGSKECLKELFAEPLNKTLRELEPTSKVLKDSLTALGTEPRQDFLENLEELKDPKELQENLEEPEDPKEQEPFTEQPRCLKERFKGLPMERLKLLKGVLVHKDQVVGTDFRARWVESNRVKGTKTGAMIDGCVMTPECSRSRLLKTLRINLMVGKLGLNGGAKPEAI